MKNQNLIAFIATFRNLDPLFRLGHVSATHGALDLLDRTGTNALMLLRRHESGDWGDIDQSDSALNNEALRTGGRLLSAYNLGQRRERLWIITEADRSSTTILLPEEY